MTDRKIEPTKKLLSKGVFPHDMAQNLGMCIPALYRWIPASTNP